MGSASDPAGECENGGEVVDKGRRGEETKRRERRRKRRPRREEEVAAAMDAR